MKLCENSIEAQPSQLIVCVIGLPQASRPPIYTFHLERLNYTPTSRQRVISSWMRMNVLRAKLECCAIFGIAIISNGFASWQKSMYFRCNIQFKTCSLHMPHTLHNPLAMHQHLMCYELLHFGATSVYLTYYKPLSRSLFRSLKCTTWHSG